MDIACLKLAFGYYIARSVVWADGQVVASEVEFLDHWYPKTSLQNRGLADNKGQLNERGKVALGDALLRLPALPLMERLAMLEVFQEAADADGLLLQEEVEWIEHAAWLLGVRPDQLKNLHRCTTVSSPRAKHRPQNPA